MELNFKNDKNDNRLTFSNKIFSKKINLNNYCKLGALSGLIFFDSEFKKDFLISDNDTIVNCYFQDCTFNDVVFRKFEINHCTFVNCQIVECDLTRVEFYRSSFLNCRFHKANLRASFFFECTIKETKFTQSNLEVISLTNVKYWSFDKWIMIKDSDNFEDFA